MTADDLSEVVALHREKFPTNIASRFGRRFTRRYLEMFMSSRSATCLVATRRDAVVGYLVGVLRTDEHQRHLRSRLPRLALAALPGAVWNLSFTVRVVVRRISLRLARATTAEQSSAPSGPVAVLSHIAVAEPAQRRGLGGRLVATFEHTAERRGAQTAMLATLDHDAHVGRFYERRGWELHDLVTTADGRRLRIYRVPMGEAAA